MKKILLAAIGLLLLASCTGDLPGLKLDNLISFGGGDGPQGFYANLSNEYKNLAEYETEYMQHEDDASHFQGKARRALRQQDVMPDDPSEYELPDFAREELTEAHVMVMDALEHMQSDENAALLAMAQTRYDCWLAHQQDFPTEDAFIACKDEFYNALDLLSVPPEDNVIYSVYFDSASTSLTDESRKKLGEIAVRYVDRPHWVFVLTGFTDTTGSKSENKTLSMRRAIAVKNTLGQYGVGIDNVIVGAGGEVDTEKEGLEDKDSRRVDIRVRPTYIDENKKKVKIAPGWRHSIGS